MRFWEENQKLEESQLTIQKMIGGGGFGVTYRAIENNTGKLVVIKTLNHWQQEKENFDKLQVKFVNEAMRLAQCNHPHIVKAYRLVKEEDLWGIVMEYIDGEDLSDYIIQNRKRPEAEALRYIFQIGEALEYVHQQGLLHRDVKPSNILVRRNSNEAVLIDFGLAREFTLNKTGSVTNARTEGYAPIEQYERRGNFAPYTDVYALAATLYSLVTAEVPLPSVFRKYAELPPPKQFNSQISDRVNDAIVKGMGLEPQDRPQTVREWLELLQPTVKSSTQTPKLTKSFDFQYAKIDKNLNITYHPGQAEYFTEDLGNGVVLEMVAIPGGTFMMGSPESEEQRMDYESPQHQVTIQPFFMGKFTITQEQYAAVMGKNPSYFKGEKRPVEKVSWNDAVEFCAILSDKTGKKYQLPSEAQWDYSCRAGTKTPFHFGETITTDLVNYNGNYTYGSAPKGEYREETTNVGIFPPNAFGLYDMHGNVWEWCKDTWHENYIGAPNDGTAWFDNDNRYRLLRGGSWLNNPENCRCAYRSYNNPDFDLNGNGFRVMCVGFREGLNRP